MDRQEYLKKKKIFYRREGGNTVQGSKGEPLGAGKGRETKSIQDRKGQNSKRENLWNGNRLTRGRGCNRLKRESKRGKKIINRDAHGDT